jgi:PAS domain S-box-containing protein
VLVTALTMVFGLVMAMVRSGVERRALRYADRQIRLLAAACEQSDDPMLILRGGVIRYANPAFCAATGYRHDELASVAPTDLAPPGSGDLTARIAQMESSRELTRVRAVIRRKDGTTFQADCTVASITDAGQSGPHLVCVIRDVTEQLRLQEQLVQFERMSAIGELLSGVALELSSPMQSVVGTLEVLRQSERTSELQDDIARASREADRAVRIIKNLLAFVKRAPSERLLTDFNEIVQSALAVRAAALGTSRIEVQTEYAAALPLVQINRDELRQAIVNLIINAEQSMISAHGVGTLVIRTWLNGADAVVDVCDDGPGVPAELAGRIFEPFFSARKGMGGGVGLGLSAAFGIIVAHGGRLELMPVTNGACFRLTLPGGGFAGPVHAQPARG